MEIYKDCNPLASLEMHPSSHVELLLTKFPQCAARPTDLHHASILAPLYLRHTYWGITFIDPVGHAIARRIPQKLWDTTLDISDAPL